MKTTIELTDEQLDEVVRLALISQYECARSTSDWYLDEDRKYDKKIRKALRKVIRHNSTPEQWEDFCEDYNDKCNDTG